MRYPPEQKEHSRAKLVRKSAVLVKKEGFAASGVDALARAAGLTSGAFYRHFEGKGELLAAILEEEIEKTRARLAALPDDSEEALLSFVDAYLSLAHVRRPESGCVLPTLTAEIARAPAATRVAFEESLAKLSATLVEKIGDPALASAILSQCVGAVMLARGLPTEASREATLAAARAGVRALLGSRR